MSALSVFQALRPLLVSALRTSCVNNHARSSVVLLTPVRHKTNNPRKKTPHVAQEREKWIKKRTKDSGVVVKDTRGTETESWLSRKPVDDVWIRTYFPRPKYSLEEALQMHREYAVPAMLDNAEGVIFVDMELNMTTSKKTKFLKALSATVHVPHHFDDGAQKRCAVFCKKPEDIEKAKQLNAAFVGDTELIRQIQDGEIDPTEFEFALCTPDAFVEMIGIRTILKGKFPNKTRGNLGIDVAQMINNFSNGISFESTKETDAVSKIQVPFGKLNMSDEQLSENLQAIIQTVSRHRSEKLGPIVKKILVIAPPSTERFLLWVEDYVPGYKTRKSVQIEEESSDEELKQEDAN